MGDSTCLLQMQQQQPFSYVSGPSINASNESNPMHALSQSVSFGRFMSEPLAWEKWSTFTTHKRYAEEAQSYAQPGSVAQKKAFFEAHYKELAARKAAAAALEQEQAASGDSRESECNNLQISESQVSIQEREAKVVPSSGPGLVLEANRPNSNPVLANTDSKEVSVMKPTVTSSNVKPSLKVTVSDNDRNLGNIEVGQMELAGTPSMEKPLLKDLRLNQENSVPRNKKLVFSSLRTSIHSRPSKAVPTPAKPIASVWPKRGSNATPISKKSSMDCSEKRKSTPKSTYKSMSFAPARELNKLTSTVIRKIENSRCGASSSSKAYNDKNCSTPLRTPIMASRGKVDKHALATPHSDNRRAKTYLDPASDSKPVGSRWCFLSIDCSKYLSASRNKAQSPSTVFSLRTEERAARRKEKLEEKFNSKFTEKVQLQTKIKEKAETEIKRLRQTLCFKARPLPDFYKDRSTTNNETTKVPLHPPQSPKFGKKLTPSTLMGLTALPQKPTVKNSSSKKVLAKNGQAPTSILTARFRMPAHENASPNIQHV